MLGDVRIGAGQQNSELGQVRAGGPHLLSGDDVLIPVGDGPSRQPGEVRPRSWLREQLAPHLFAPQQGADEALQLLG